MAAHILGSLKTALTITVRDAQSNPLAGRSVAFAALGSGNTFSAVDTRIAVPALVADPALHAQRQGACGVNYSNADFCPFLPTSFCQHTPDNVLCSIV